MDKFTKRLMELSDLEEGQRRKELNHSPPTECDICGAGFGDSLFFIDGRRMNSLMWANMCPRCFFEGGAGLGCGDGQLYMKQANGEWLMTAGFWEEN